MTAMPHVIAALRLARRENVSPDLLDALERVRQAVQQTEQAEEQRRRQETARKGVATRQARRQMRVVGAKGLG